MRNNSFAVLILFVSCVVIPSVSCKSSAVSTPVPDATKTYVAQYAGTSDFTITKKYETGFESLNDFTGFFIMPQNYLGTTSHDMTATVKYSGNFSHYAWMYGTNAVTPGVNTNHRGYPTVQLHKYSTGTMQGMVFCEFMVKLNMTLYNEADKGWFSFATFCSYSDDLWQRVYLVNLDYDYHVHLMHVPGQTQNVCDIPTTTKTFPMNQWVKLSILIDYTAENEYSSPYIKVWQDGELVSAARFNPRVDPNTVSPALWPECLNSWDGISIDDAETLCGLTYTGGLAQAHFGLYAPPLLSSGEVWNDNLIIMELTR